MKIDSISTFDMRFAYSDTNQISLRLLCKNILTPISVNIGISHLG